MYLAHVFGAPVEWNGRSMQEAHEGMNIKEADFNKFVSDLIVSTLKEMQISQELIDETIMSLLSMKNDIVAY